MGPTVEELNKVLQIKKQIKQAIINKGVEITDTTSFAAYPSKIDSIPDRYNDGYGNGYNDGYSNGYDEGNANGGGADPFYEVMWNAITNNNTDYEYLFYKYNGTELDLSSFDTSNVTNMGFMFYNCSKLTSLDLSNFNTSNVTDMGSMFQFCSKLISLDLSNFDTSKVTDMSSMFAYCSSLISLDMSNCDASKCTGSSSMSIVGTSSLNACTALVDFIAPKNISAPMNVTYCTALSHDSLMSIINNLITVTSSKKLTLGTTNLAKLSDEEKAIATNKGWTLA